MDFTRVYLIRALPLILVTATVALSVAASVASAATIRPTMFTDQFNGDDNCSLREALIVANSDTPGHGCQITGTLGEDEIVLDEGTYVLSVHTDDTRTGDLDINPAAGTPKKLTIRGAGPSATVIQGTAGWDDRILHIEGLGVELTLEDLQIVGGNAVSGSSSGVKRGGGVLIGPGEPGHDVTIRRTHIRNNRADGPGGGISVGSGSRLRLIQSEVSSNSTSATNGGGIEAGGDLTVERSLIRGNSVGHTSPVGGGVSVLGTGANVEIVDSLVIGNHLEDEDAFLGGTGAGLWVNSGEVTISGTAITSNSLMGAPGRGAGITVAGGSVTLVNATVSQNETSSLGEGGGLYIQAGQARLVHVTMADNSATSARDIRQIGGSIALRGSVVGSSEGLAQSCHATGGTLTSGGFNIAADDSCGLNGLGDLQGIGPKLGPAGQAPELEVGVPGLEFLTVVHLPQDGSPAIDHTPAASCLGLDDKALLLTDQRGLSRFHDGDGDGQFDCDAGAVEVQTDAGGQPPDTGGPGDDPAGPGGPGSTRGGPGGQPGGPSASGAGAGRAHDTVIVRGPKRKVRLRGRDRRAAVRFAFRSQPRGARFQCRLQGRHAPKKLRRFRPCRSPRAYRLRPGSYRFAVRAVAPGGRVDPTPARRSFRIVRGAR